MVAGATNTQASPTSGEVADPLKGAVRAAAVHAAALVMVNAAQHLQRVTLLVETATARALADADGRRGGEMDRDIDNGVAVASAALFEAMNLFKEAQAHALALTPDS